MLRLARNIHRAQPRLLPLALQKNVPRAGFSVSLNRNNESAATDKETGLHKYADTVILPKTEFGSRSDQKLIETVLKPQTMQKLYEWNITRPLKDNRIENLFIFHDGPPYANGNLHIGHALNKVLKDIINRYELMLGKKVHYVPGWDCHGLPIELKTLEKLGKERKEVEKKLKKDLKKASSDEEKDQIRARLHSLKHTRLSPTDIVRLSSEHAMNTQKSQSREFQEIGIMGDFEHPYMTLKKSFVTDQLRVFKKFFNNGLVRRQEKPVYWGCENATALAEGELEYNQQHQSKAAYVKFPIVEVSEALQKSLGSEIIEAGISALIWTSTPWTLASNLAISINEGFEYTVIHNEKFGNLVVSTELIPSLEEIFEFSKSEVVFKGSELLGCKYESPILNNGHKYPFLHGSHVTSTAGTGLVHTAPGHGQDDYLVCLQNGIKPYSPVDKYGKYTDALGENLAELVGLRVLGEGNAKMIERIKELGILIHLNENYIHSYPYDWRSKKPIIIRATPQWFIDVSKIKDVTIEALKKKVNFHPERGVNRLTSFIKTRNEWCISRQRSWGVPIPVLYHRETGEVLLDDAVIGRIIEVIELEGIEGWFEQVEKSQQGADIGKWLPDEYQHLAKDYVLGTDTMDVWFDSGSSWKTIEHYLEDEGLLEQAKARGYLSDVYLEGSDQHRGWFQSSVLAKVGSEINGNGNVVMPYKNIITHGFTLDEKGEKMSKSLGNTMSPGDVLQGNKQLGVPKIGIDGLRLWVAQSDYTNDINVGPTILKHVGDNLKKLRFTFKFLLGNLNGFDTAKSSLRYEDMNRLDQYVLSRLARLNAECLHEYEAHNFFKIVKLVNHFINVDLSSIYFDVRKDALYTDRADSPKRVSTLVAFNEVLHTLVSILAPIVPIITQEVWNSLPDGIKGALDSPFHRGWYNSAYVRVNEDVENDFAHLLDLKDAVNGMIGQLRAAKHIRSPLECRVVLQPAVPTPGDDSIAVDAVLPRYSDPELEDLFVVSSVVRNEPNPVADSRFHVQESVRGVHLHVVEAPGGKCPRCWKHASVSAGLCLRCADAVGVSKR